MIEFVTEYGKKISVNPKYVMAIQPQKRDGNVTVMTFVNGEFLEVAHSYNNVLEMIKEGQKDETN